mmetsp:Transcript_72281/g.197950  ORF Transcript_72281/g.197950 Transcript_72281/m.197950 type:complete len:276 (-) Transcript_72281:1295-2122(-)
MRICATAPCTRGASWRCWSPHNWRCSSGCRCPHRIGLRRRLQAQQRARTHVAARGRSSVHGDAQVADEEDLVVVLLLECLAGRSQLRRDAREASPREVLQERERQHADGEGARGEDGGEGDLDPAANVVAVAVVERLQRRDERARAVGRLVDVWEERLHPVDVGSLRGALVGQRVGTARRIERRACVVAQRAALDVGVRREEERERHDGHEQRAKEQPQRRLLCACGAKGLVWRLVAVEERRVRGKIERRRLERAPDEHHGHEHRSHPHERLTVD